MEKPVLFDAPGCYADGAAGWRHVRDVLADMAEAAGADSELVASLRGPMPDDACDEDEALNVLQARTKDGLIWVFDSGDLLLLPESEMEP